RAASTWFGVTPHLGSQPGGALLFFGPVRPRLDGLAPRRCSDLAAREGRGLGAKCGESAAPPDGFSFGDCSDTAPPATSAGAWDRPRPASAPDGSGRDADRWAGRPDRGKTGVFQPHNRGRLRPGRLAW